MTFENFKSKVEEGDLVILYLSLNQIYSVCVETHTISKKGARVDNVLQTPFGSLKCADLIGKLFGSRIKLSRGWGNILQPTPELWTLTLPHRTQIIYTPDISMIIFQLEISPGSIVVESGTGSGSLSHAIIRTIKPLGHLYTFDFHESRVELAKKEFENHGLSNYVTVAHQDVCKNGFGPVLESKADSVFLDLPHPWQVIPHTLHVMKTSGGRLCSFSPCVEQAQNTCGILQKSGFQEIQTIEVLQTPYTVQQKKIPKLNLSFIQNEKTGNETKEKDKEFSVSANAVPSGTMQGHTGYLTIATLPPIYARTLQTQLNEININ